MKKLIITLLLTVSLCTLIACGKADSSQNTEKEISVDGGNFSSEMIIKDSSDVTIVEMP